MSVYEATYNAKDEDGNALEPVKISAEYNFGGTVQEATELFGEAVVLSGFTAHGVVQLQSRMRAAAKAGNDVQATINDWKPGVAAPRKDPVEAMESRFEKMSPEQQVALIEKLRTKASGGTEAPAEEPSEPETEPEAEPGEED